MKQKKLRRNRAEASRKGQHFPDPCRVGRTRREAINNGAHARPLIVRQILLARA
jgi:hypothetical protein